MIFTAISSPNDVAYSIFVWNALKYGPFKQENLVHKYQGCMCECMCACTMRKSSLNYFKLISTMSVTSIFGFFSTVVLLGRVSGWNLMQIPWFQVTYVFTLMEPN